MMEEVFLAQTDRINKQVKNILDVQAKAELLGASLQMSSRGCSQSRQQKATEPGVSPSQLALPKAEEILNKLKTCMSQDQGASGCPTSGLDTDGLKASIARTSKAPSVADVNRLLTQEVNELAKWQAGLRQLPT